MLGLINILYFLGKNRSTAADKYVRVACILHIFKAALLLFKLRAKCMLSVVHLMVIFFCIKFMYHLENCLLSGLFTGYVVLMSS